MKNKAKKIFFMIFIFFLILMLLIVIFSFPHQALLPPSHYRPPVQTQAPVAIKTIPIEKQLGQNFIVGIPQPSLDQESREILQYIQPAGIVLYRRNFTSFDQFKSLVKELQDLAIASTGLPYLIMLDEEPEGANRLGLLKNIFTLGNPDWKRIEEDVNLLSDMGINVLLAPLADFPFLPNAFITRRIPFDCPENLKTFNRSFIRIVQDNNMFTTLKHFPGLGIFLDDPHHAYLQTEKDLDVLQSSIDLFNDGIQHGTQFIMTSHAQYDSLDATQPSTFSPYIVTQMLKKELGFEGIIVSDDLSDMPLAIERLDLTYAGLRALQSGHHLIMYSHHLAYTRNLFDNILQALSQNPELRKTIFENYQKITNFKTEHLLEI